MDPAILSLLDQGDDFAASDIQEADVLPLTAWAPVLQFIASQPGSSAAMQNLARVVAERLGG